jgi:hypothetical protein
MKLRPIAKNLIVLVTIITFSTFSFSFPGKKNKEKEKYGQLEVTSTAKEAAVFIEGFNMGTPPLKLENVQPGLYRVIVKAPGYDDFIEDVKVEKQEVSKVDARMTVGGKGTKVPVCDYSNWESISKSEKSKLERTTYSSLLLGYQNIEVANFDLMINNKNPVPPWLLFLFYSDMIEKIDKYTDFPQIITGYTDIEGMTEVKKVYAPGKANQDGNTLVLSGVLTKYKKGRKGKGTSQNLPVSSGFGVGITISGDRSPKFSILFRLTDKKEGRVIFNQLISGPVGPVESVGEEFAKALKDAVDTLRKREKEKETGH